jgi:hypothetical protein
VTRVSKATSLAALTALVIAGCGGGDKPKPKPIAGQPKAVVAAVATLDSAIKKHSWQAVCDLMTPAARSRSGGVNCGRTLAEAGSGVSRSNIRVLSVAVKGRRAAVKVRTRARGQDAIDETIVLARPGKSWLVDSLLG